MKFSEAWLRTFVNPALGSADLAEALTMAGLEVESRESIAREFSRVVVGHVLSVERHPNAERLKICRVDAGEGEPLQIVCGAPNVASGIKVPLALAGAWLAGVAIERTAVRGVESYGMLCSAKELGIDDDDGGGAGGLLILPNDAAVGQDFRDFDELNDRIFTLKLTPNRADCFSLTGIAREVAAITATSLYLVKVAPVATGIDDRVEVAADPDACPRYCGRIVRGVDMRARTPRWIQRRLSRSGLRSISAVVDVTNYVMLELGQPLHAFDLAKIDGGIDVRMARAGEKLKLLNDTEISLAPDMLVIADQREPLALAGVMGGAESAVSATTVDVFLESAYFDPRAIAGRSRRFGFTTDSAQRFERGVDFAATGDALERATQLLLEICGGRAGPISGTLGRLPRRDPIRLRAKRVERVLGVAIPARKISPLLRRLHLSFVEQDSEFHVTPHSYRFDLEREEDLIEEIARIHGYAQLPSHKPKGQLAMLPAPEARAIDAVKATLVARDYREIISYSFVDADWERDFSRNENPIAVRNPIATQLSMMRSQLIGGLISALRYNLNRQHDRVRVFEIGRCFVRDADGITQPERVAGLCYGNVEPEQWGVEARSVDLFDVKADLAALCAPAGLQTEAAQHPAFQPGRCARVIISGKPAGWLGVLHPKWRQKYELPLAPVLFELQCDSLMLSGAPAYREVSKLPMVRRDLALIVDEQVGSQVVLDHLKAGLPATAIAVELFDLYRGLGMEAGKKSLAFRILLQDTRKTLTESQVHDAIANTIEVLGKKHGYKLRI